MSYFNNTISKVTNKRGRKKRLIPTQITNISSQVDQTESCILGNHRERKPLGELTNQYSRRCNNTEYIASVTNTNTTSTNNTNSLPRKKRKSKIYNPISDESLFNQVNISRRNERERNRVKLINLGFDRLRSVVPSRHGEQLSKISTLKKAIWYIEHLDKVLHGQDKLCSDPVLSSASTYCNVKQTMSTSKTATSKLSSSVTIETGLTSPSSSSSSSIPSKSSMKHETGCTQLNKSVELARTINNDIRSTTSCSYLGKYLSSLDRLGQESTPIRTVNTHNNLSPIFPPNWDPIPISTNIAISETEYSKLDLSMKHDSGYISMNHSSLNESNLNKMISSPILSNPSSSSLWWPCLPVTNGIISSSTITPTQTSTTTNYYPGSMLNNEKSFNFNLTDTFPHLQWILNQSYSQTNK